MKHSKLLDRVMELLYGLKDEDSSFDLGNLLSKHEIHISEAEMIRVARRLEEERFANVQIHTQGALIDLTSQGVQFCEESSFTKVAYPIIQLSE